MRNASPAPSSRAAGASALSERIAAIIKTRSRTEWMEAFADDDHCVAPVLRYGEALGHPHIAARQTYVSIDDVLQPAPAPRFDRTPATLDRPPAPAGHHTDEVLVAAGFTDAERAELRASGAVG